MVNGSNSTSIGNNSNQSTVPGGQINMMALGNSSNNTGANQVRIGNSVVGSIGGYANWSNVSDQRFKKNVEEDVLGLSFINELRPVTYNLDIHAIDDWFADNHNVRDSSLAQIGYEKENIKYSGFLAQEVENTANQLGYDFSGVDKPQSELDFYGLRYAEFVVPLVKAVQELSGEVIIQESINNALSDKIAAQDLLIINLIQRIEALEEK
jgi:hypothetical protein